LAEAAQGVSGVPLSPTLALFIGCIGKSIVGALLGHLSEPLLRTMNHKETVWRVARKGKIPIRFKQESRLAGTASRK